MGRATHASNQASSSTGVGATSPKSCDSDTSLSMFISFTSLTNAMALLKPHNSSSWFWAVLHPNCYCRRCTKSYGNKRKPKLIVKCLLFTNCKSHYKVQSIYTPILYLVQWYNHDDKHMTMIQVVPVVLLSPCKQGSEGKVKSVNLPCTVKLFVGTESE